MPDSDNTFPIPPLTPKDGTPPAQPAPTGAAPAQPMPSNDWASSAVPASNPEPVANAVPNAPMPQPTTAVPASPPPAMPVSEPVATAPTDAAAPVVSPPPAAPVAPVTPAQEAIPAPSLPVDDGLGTPPPGSPGSTMGAVVPPAAAQQPPMPTAAPTPTEQAMPSQQPTNMLDLSGQQTATPVDNSLAPPAPTSDMEMPAPTLPSDTNPQLLAADASMLGGDMGMAEQKPKSSIFKKLLIALLIFVGLVVVLSLVLYITGRSSRKPAIELNDQTNQNQQTQQNNNSATPAAIPEGYVKIDRDCFSFGFPSNNSIPSGESACAVTAKLGKLGLGQFVITPGTNPVNSVDELVNPVKNANKVTSEEDVQINGIAAKKLTIEGGPSGQNVKYLVLVKDKGYTFSGKPIISFDITISTGQEFFKQVADTAISTWQWKTATKSSTP